MYRGLDLIRDMENRGITITGTPFAALASSCAQLRRSFKTNAAGLMIWEEADRRNIWSASTAQLAISLSTLLGRAGNAQEIEELLTRVPQLPAPPQLCYNNLIKAYLRQMKPDKALEVYARM